MTDGPDSTVHAARVAWFNAMFDAHYAQLVRYAERHISVAEDAKQLAADTLEVAWKKLATDAPDADAWLYVTAKRKIQNYWTRQTRRRNAMTFIADSAVAPRTPEDSLDRVALHTAMASLKEREREVLVLLYWARLDAQEIAVAIGTSTQAVWKCASRARSKLREKLDYDIDHAPTDATRRKRVTPLAMDR